MLGILTVWETIKTPKISEMIPRRTESPEFPLYCENPYRA